MNFNFSDFQGVTNGQKTSTSTPLCSFKGALNLCTVNTAAIKTLKIEEDCNFYLMENPNSKLDGRYIGIILPATVKDEVDFPGAKVSLKYDLKTKNLLSANFHYSPIWGKVQGDVLINRSVEEMKLQGTLVPSGKSFVAKESVNFEVKVLEENVDIEMIAQSIPELEGIEGTTTVFQLVNPVRIPYEKKVMSGRGNRVVTEDINEEVDENEIED